MKTPIVTIHSGAHASLNSYYQEILRSIDERYHNYHTTFPVYPVSEAELVEQATMATHAQHASDGLIVKGDYASTDGGATWTHIERLLR